MIASQLTGERELNQINATMRSAPWYQGWFRSKGLNPNRVKLTDVQRRELTNLAAQHGMPLGDRMKFDQAGNINQMGGFAGMPTWAKIAIAAAPVAATAGLGVAGIGPMAGIMGAGGVGAGGTGAGLAAAGNIAAVPTVAGTGAAVAGAGSGAAMAGFGLKDIFMAGVQPAIGAGAGIYATRAQTNAARDAAQAQTDSANYAADLQSKSAEEQLAFLREQEANRRKEFEDAQARNFGIYQEERDYDRGLYAQRQQRMAPYRGFGEGSLAQLTRPIQNIAQTGSLGARAGGR